MKVMPYAGLSPLISGCRWDVLCPADAFAHYRPGAGGAAGRVTLLFTGEVGPGRRLLTPAAAKAPDAPRAAEDGLTPLYLMLSPEKMWEERALWGRVNGGGDAWQAGEGWMSLFIEASRVRRLPLSDAEKGGRLYALLRRGMQVSQVELLLGPDATRSRGEFGFTAGLHCLSYHTYPVYHISFRSVNGCVDEIHWR